MKQRIFILFALVLSFPAFSTTYTFTSLKWASKMDAIITDGVTDGFVCDVPAYEYTTGRFDAQDRLYSQGVSVKTSTSGAGATSVREFTDVTSLTFSFCQNSSKGRGVIYAQVGAAPYDSIIINKPAVSGSGVYVRDSILSFPTALSGKIKFWIKCTENAIYINSLTIHASNGGPADCHLVYRMVTDASQLQDSDQIIIGVADAGTSYIMGAFDEEVSQNNIHAIRGSYSSDRLTVAPNDNAIYTLRMGQTSKGQSAWYIQDELRYTEAYLVASGGQTKNRLALWTHLYDEKTYGDYGYWSIEVAADGEATIMNLGKSAGKYLLYNAQNSPTLFGCYPQISQTAVCIYRQLQSWDDTLTMTRPTPKAEPVPMNINQITDLPDYTMVALNDVVVTKKYDTYIFVRDTTGSLLIYDNGDGTGGRYGSDLENGHVLSGVKGRYTNYFGVPELLPMTAWTVAAQKQPAEPEVVTAIDSSDVCRYVRIENAEVNEFGRCLGLPIMDAFNTGDPLPVEPMVGDGSSLDAIVYIAWDELQLWMVRQNLPTDLREMDNGEMRNEKDNSKFLHNGRLLIRHGNALYNANGSRK